MPVRVEWTDHSQNLLVITLREPWNAQETHHVLDEWVAPRIAERQQPIGVILDVRDSRVSLAQARNLVKQLRDLVGTCEACVQLALVGLPAMLLDPDVLVTDGVAAAAERLEFMLRKQVVA